MRIEMCIPALNEERIIAESATAVRDALKKISSDSCVVVVVNGSTDDTAGRAGEVEGVSVFSITEAGKGAAVEEAARRSGAVVFGFIDADLSADPEDIPGLLGYIERNECDIAIGSRLMNTGIVKRGMLRTFSSRAFNTLRKLIVGIRVQDTQCGLKLMNIRGKDILTRCTEKGWFFDMEFLARAEHAGLRIREVPIHWDEQRFEGRVSKLSQVRDSLGALRAMIRIRMKIGTPQP